MQDEEMEAEARIAEEDKLADQIENLQKQLMAEGYTIDEILTKLAIDYRIPDAERYIIR